MIRVLHIMSTVTGGGVERTRLSIAKYLDSEKFQLKIIGTYKSGDIAKQIEDQGVEIIEIGDFNGPFHWEKHKRVRQIISDYQPHIIHGAVFEGVTMASINGFLKKVPVVIIEETSDPQNRSWRGNLLIKLFSLLADKAIAIAPNVADYLTKIAKVSPKKVVTINNGVEVPREVFEEEINQAREKYGISKSDFVVGCVGRIFNDHKKFTDIIESIAKISNPNIKLLIVGSGRDENMIIAKVVELNLQNQVIMTGYQYDTPLFYKLMDIFCISSAREGFGLVAAEAMLHKLPVIATKVGGLQNVVKNGETGYLIPPHSPDEIADKILKFYQDKELRLQFGNNGYQRAIHNFTEERYVRDIEELYLKLLKMKKVIVDDNLLETLE